MKAKVNDMTNDIANIPDYDKPEEEQPYYKKLQELLSHYEDGWNLIINAHKDKDYDYPLKRKPEPEHANNAYIPETWLELADAICQIIAKDKYELDVYPNRIEIIRSDQMLDAYTTTGLPLSYSHWSFGKRRLIEERKYDSSKHLAYEIVINSVPCVSYCMDTNTPLLQALVIAHAAYGHNAVFKNNYLFKDRATNADTILTENKSLREYVDACSRKYGEAEVRRLLDFCHAMKFVDSYDHIPFETLSPKERQEKRQKEMLDEHLNAPHTSVFNAVANDNIPDNKPKVEEYKHPDSGEKNILVFMAENAPHLPEWKRHIMRSVARLSQYFRPQMMTKVLNEGMATFVHDKVLTTMRDIGLIDWGMYEEYTQINAGVLFQQSSIYKKQNPWTGELEEDFRPVSFNPYTLGLAILRDIERICKNPTAEDREWFPHFAGDPDWLGMVKHAVFSSSDETLIEQYLSPAVMRKLGMIAVKSQSDEEMSLSEITDIHAGDGFKKIRAILASDQRLWDKLPKITMHDYQEKTDRCLVLRHHVTDGRRIDAKDAQMILEFMHFQWEHPVVLESVDPTGKTLATLSSPLNYDYKKFTPVRLKMAP